MSIVYASESNRQYIPAPFARAPYFIITDLKYSHTTKRTITNPFKDIPGNASAQVIAYLTQEYEMTEVHALDFGAKAVKELRRHRVRMYATKKVE